MIRKIIFIVSFWILGLACSALIYRTLRKLIQHLYGVTTSGKIKLVGKDFYFFEHPAYYLSFAFSFMIIGVSLMKLPASKWFKQILIYIVFLMISLYLASLIMARLALATCTACDDGVMRISYNQLPYALISIISSLMSIVPSLVLLWKQRSK